MWERRHNVIVCFYIVSLPGHSINKCISFSDYRWQYLYCLMMLLLTWELLAGGIWKWEHNLEIRIKKLDLEQNIFLQTKKKSFNNKNTYSNISHCGQSQESSIFQVFQGSPYPGFIEIWKSFNFQAFGFGKKAPTTYKHRKRPLRTAISFLLGCVGTSK